MALMVIYYECIMFIIFLIVIRVFFFFSLTSIPSFGEIPHSHFKHIIL